MKTEAALGHFRDGFVLRPSLDDNAVDRAHQAAPVRPKMTVEIERRAVPVREELQEADGVLILRVPDVHRNLFVGQVRTGDFISVTVEETEADDRLHAHRLELAESLRGGLSAAVKIVRDTMKIRQAGFLDPDRPAAGRRWRRIDPLSREIEVQRNECGHQ